MTYRKTFAFLLVSSAAIVSPGAAAVNLRLRGSGSEDEVERGSEGGSPPMPHRAGMHVSPTASASEPSDAGSNSARMAMVNRRPNQRQRQRTATDDDTGSEADFGTNYPSDGGYASGGRRNSIHLQYMHQHHHPEHSGQHLHPSSLMKESWPASGASGPSQIASVLGPVLEGSPPPLGGLLEPRKSKAEKKADKKALKTERRNGGMSSAVTAAVCAVSDFGDGGRGSQSSAASASAGDSVIHLDPPHGTRDFYPEEMRQQRWLLNKWHATAKAFGFEEYDSSILEHAGLWTRKQGDDVTKEMYAFDLKPLEGEQGELPDAYGHAVTLRPEMTPTFARMLLKKMKRSESMEKAELGTPGNCLKWYSVPQCFRYESTQKGRKREFYQWNMDIAGVSEKEQTAEAELLEAVVHFLKSVELEESDVRIRVSSKKVLQVACRAAGIDDAQFDEVVRVLDKIEKIGEVAVLERLSVDGARDGEPALVDSTAASKVLSVIRQKSLADVKDALTKIVKEKTEEEGDEKLQQQLDEVMGELETLFALAEVADFSQWLVFDVTVVRGLSYYTGMVFEAMQIDEKGEYTGRALAGGGRYDRLMNSFGLSEQLSMPLVGFGLGDVVIRIALEERNLLPEASALKEDEEMTFVFAERGHEGDAKTLPEAVRAAAALRNQRREPVRLHNEAIPLKQGLKLADRLGARYAVFVRPADIDSGIVRVKDMRRKWGQNSVTGAPEIKAKVKGEAAVAEAVQWTQTFDDFARRGLARPSHWLSAPASPRESNS